MMLSPGRWHELVPKDLRQNLLFRKMVLEAALESDDFRQGILHICSQDILFYVNVFVWQFDPTQGDDARVGPFITWSFQERYYLDAPETTGEKGLLWCVENKRPMVIEKSREMGATWLALICEDWLCLFRKNYQALNISKSANAVDDNTKNSLFKKIRSMHECLPHFVKGELVEQKMYNEFKRTSSEQAGEASSKRSGVGGRGGYVFIDEAGEIEELRQVKEKLANTAPFRLYVSTHLGVGNPFFEITKDPSFVKRQFHWTQHPAKNKGLYSYDTAESKLRFWVYNELTDELNEVASNGYDYGKYVFDLTGKPTGGPFPGIRSPWYDMKAAEIGDDRGVAQQLDINPTGADSQFYSPIMIRELKRRCMPHFWEGELRHDENGKPLEFVSRKSGHLRLWFNLCKGMPPASGYGVGADVALGNGASSSCLSFGDGRTGTKVAEYVNNEIDPEDFAILAVALCNAFADEDGSAAILVWENHGPGAAFGRKTLKLGFTRLMERLDETSLRPERTGKVGFVPTKASKMTLHVEYRSALMNHRIFNPSVRALDECLSFRHTTDGAIEHARIKSADPGGSNLSHGDITVSDALMWLVIRSMPRLTEIEQSTKVYDVRSLFGRRELRKQLMNEDVWVT